MSRIITEITDEDIEKLLDIGEKLVAESRFEVHGYNREKVRLVFLATRKLPQKFFIAYDENCRGMCLLGMNTHYFNDYKWATDFAFFVVPEARGSSLALRLLREGEKWAKANGAHELTILHNTGIQTDKSTRFFHGVGYETKGHIYTKGFK